MNQDLKIIKKKYGEKMMHLCRDLFPTILEKEGVLSKILLDTFEPSRFLYDDIITNKLTEKFKNYIYNVFDSSFRKQIKAEKTPYELMSDAGYILYECKTEEDIQGFRKYYKKSEELCTFNGDRLDNCYVYFAVKKNVDEIKREDFKNPQRQDLYGTSVISIQFTKDASHILSIKNRYNHTVENPDATFGNNLDNIIEGLTDSFEIYCDMKQKVKSDDFEIPGYVMANDGKYYKYNMEIYNIYYCPENIIIDNFEVKRYPKEKYIIMDYFILDLKSGEVRVYDYVIEDTFEKTMKYCGKPIVYKEENYKKIIFDKDIFNKDYKEPIIIMLDNLNNIIGLENNNIKEIGRNFLYSNKKIRTINLSNVETIEDAFLEDNEELEELSLPKVKHIGSSFLSNNKKIKNIYLPNVQTINSNFLYNNEGLSEINFPNVTHIYGEFLYNNKIITKIELPKVNYIGDGFLCMNKELERIILPNVEIVGDAFLFNNMKLRIIEIPNVEKIGAHFLAFNLSLKELDLSNVRSIGNKFLYVNDSLRKIYIPKVEDIGFSFLHSNENLEEIEIPNVDRIGSSFLYENKKLKKVNLPNVTCINDDFLYNNESLIELNLPNVQMIGNRFIYSNRNLRKLDLPNIEYIGNSFLYNNTKLKELNISNVKEKGTDFLYSNEKINEKTKVKKLIHM